MGKWKQGESGNLSGRPAGIRNKGTEALRRVLSKFITANIHTIQQDYDSLKSGKDRLFFIEKFIRHVLPSPVNELEKLSDEDLDRIISKLKNRQL
jgi:hypothetical protein